MDLKKDAKKDDQNGEKIGEARGERRAKEKTAKKLLDLGLEVVTISEATGLTKEEITKLKKEAN